MAGEEEHSDRGDILYIRDKSPALAPPNDVQITALGSFRLKEQYPDGAPGGASNPVAQAAP